MPTDPSYWLGKAVTFKPHIEEWDEWLVENMRGRITSIEQQQPDVCKVFVDTTEFEEFNRPLEEANFYDNRGNPTMTARERGFFNLVVTGYVENSEDLLRLCELLEIDSNITQAMQHHKETAPNDLYVAYLEKQLSNAMNAGFQLQD